MWSIDPVGGEAFAAATRAIAHEGRLLAVGFASGAWGNPSAPHLVARNYSVMGVLPAGYDRRFREEAHAELLRLWRAGRIGVRISRRFDFERVPEAVSSVASGEVMGKVVVEILESRVMEEDVALDVNGEMHRVRVEPGTPLLYVLRNDLGLPARSSGAGSSSAAPAR